jgi:hypothetical protein
MQCYILSNTAGLAFRGHEDRLIRYFAAGRESWEGSAASLAASLIFGFFFLRWAIPEIRRFWEVSGIAPVGPIGA